MLDWQYFLSALGICNSTLFWPPWFLLSQLLIYWQSLICDMRCFQLGYGFYQFNYDMSRYEFLWDSPTWCWCVDYCFSSNLGNLGPSYLQIFFLSLSPLLIGFPYVYLGTLDGVQQVSETLFIFISSLYSSDWII